MPDIIWNCSNNEFSLFSIFTVEHIYSDGCFCNDPSHWISFSPRDHHSQLFSDGTDVIDNVKAAGPLIQSDNARGIYAPYCFNGCVA